MVIRIGDWFSMDGQPMDDDEAAHLLGQPDYKTLRVTDSRAENGGLDWRVSTVWLGLNHEFRIAMPPMIFETMVFGGGKLDQYCQRYSTIVEAVAGHLEVVRLVQAHQR